MSVKHEVLLVDIKLSQRFYLSNNIMTTWHNVGKNSHDIRQTQIK